MMNLADMPIEEIARGDSPLGEDEARKLSQYLPEWTIEGDKITRKLEFSDFAAAMAFVNNVADEAEAADHHPDISISYNKVELSLSTHKIGGLSRNDFILAARIDRHAGP
ncbi:MAG: 4a-hydroxytetrahydrobiopterin dehydratase [Acidobacteriota bacterium]|jgi:4a-hydroxytetrahydrobiopterin dehydratase|nr:4a-hydroxytetrahydrobiopterin dehydratase [Acidobacteriota bacterium]